MCLAINGKAMAGMRKMYYLCNVFPMGLQALLLSLVNLGNSMARRQADSLCTLVSVSCVKRLLYSLLSEFRAKEGKCFALFFFFTISKTILGYSKAGRTLESEGNRRNEVLP